MKIPRLAVVLALVAAYASVIRPKLLRWGATDEEVRRPYPGVDLIPGGTRSATNAITIEAPPAKVWPWLVQMGYGRAGWYSWDRLDNFGRRSTEEIRPEWQKIALGDHLAAKPDGSEWWEVAALEPERVRSVVAWGAMGYIDKSLLPMLEVFEGVVDERLGLRR